MLEIRLEFEENGLIEFFDLHDHDWLLSDHKKTSAGYVPPKFSSD
jgi:hypothetical protein